MTSMDAEGFEHVRGNPWLYATDADEVELRDAWDRAAQGPGAVQAWLDEGVDGRDSQALPGAWGDDIYGPADDALDEADEL